MVDLENEIKRIEELSSTEIVIRITGSSDSYLRIKLLLSLMGILVTSCILLLWNYRLDWHMPLITFFTWQLVGGVLFATLAQMPLLIRLVSPRSLLYRNVERQAFQEFSRLGIYRTTRRTGILILVSKLEHLVIILADEGINQKVKPEFWSARAQEISLGFKTNFPLDAFKKSLKEIETILVEHFPPEKISTNELSDKIQLD